METVKRPYVAHLAPGEGDALRVFGELNTFKMKGASYTVFESTTPPGGGMPPHVHYDQEETVYVLEGEYTLISGEKELVMGPGSLVSIPGGTTHAFEATGEAAGRCLVILTPPGPLERFFEEVGTPVTGGALFESSEEPPGMEKVLAGARRNGIELLVTPV